MMAAILEDMTTTSPSVPWNGTDIPDDERSLLADAYANVLNWVEVATVNSTAGVERTNRLQLSEEEIIAYLDSNLPPWKYSDYIFDDRNLVADWIVVIEIRIHHDYVKAMARAESEYFSVKEMNYIKLKYTINSENVLQTTAPVTFQPSASPTATANVTEGNQKSTASILGDVAKIFLILFGFMII